MHTEKVFLCYATASKIESVSVPGLYPFIDQKENNLGRQEIRVFMTLFHSGIQSLCSLYVRVHAGPHAHVNTVTWQRFAPKITQAVDGHRAVVASVSSKLLDCQEKCLTPVSSDQCHMTRLLNHGNVRISRIK